MKPSFYNMFFEYPDESKTVLYNSLYGSLILVNSLEKDIINKIFSSVSEIKLFDNELIEALIDQKFLIENEIDEISILKNRKQQGIDDENRLDIVIMPTLNCNFRCVYCYENHIASSMSKETESALIKWFEQEIPLHKFILVHWYGGEPLLEVKTVLKISKQIKLIAEKYGVGLSIHMTTNGYLFNSDNIEKLVSCGIIDYQITLDGTKEFHDKLRILKNGNATFERIVSNIISIARTYRNVKISLRVNFNHTNFDSIPKLLEIFPQDIRKQLRVAFEPIFGNCSINAVSNIDIFELSEKLSTYYNLSEKIGYDVVLGISQLYIGKLVYCYAERRNQYIINYNRDVYKCSVSDFSDDRVGYIDEYGYFKKDENNFSKWVNDNFFDDKCLKCQFLPLCMGGCKKTRIENHNTGSVCNLVPSNTSYLLKQVAFGGLKDLIKS